MDAVRELWTQVGSLLEDHDRFIGDHPEYSHYQGWLRDLGLLVSINVALWLVSLIAGKCWPVDFIWSSWPGILAGKILLTSYIKFVSPKQWLFFGVLWFWGLRLTSNFVLRGGIGHEDWRYVEMRHAIGPRLFPLLSLPMVFLGQSVFNYLGCLSIYSMMRNRFSIVSPLDLVGLFITLTAIVIETAADEQLDEFVRSRSSPGQILDKGLWGWSRHPNYFGECLFWWGLWVCGGCELGPSLAGPVAMTLLFLGISIPLMEERHLERKGQAFEEYQERVPFPLVPVPPSLALILCPRRKQPAQAEEEKEEQEQKEEEETEKKEGAPTKKKKNETKKTK